MNIPASDFVIPAKAVVLSTGGAGQIYARTTNPANATGDGMAMAFRAGAELQDMEFVQFHPTSLYLPSSPPFLIVGSHARRGRPAAEHQGEMFMHRYHPLGVLGSSGYRRAGYLVGNGGDAFASCLF